jgi:hypothetical protein
MPPDISKAIKIKAGDIVHLTCDCGSPCVLKIPRKKFIRLEIKCPNCGVIACLQPHLHSVDGGAS